MKVGDLVSVEGIESMCLVTGIYLAAGGDYEMVDVFYMTGKQKRWSTARYRVSVINETD